MNTNTNYAVRVAKEPEIQTEIKGTQSIPKVKNLEILLSQNKSSCLQKSVRVISNSSKKCCCCKKTRNAKQKQGSQVVKVAETKWNGQKPQIKKQEVEPSTVSENARDEASAPIQTIQNVIRSEPKQENLIKSDILLLYDTFNFQAVRKINKELTKLKREKKVGDIYEINRIDFLRPPKEQPELPQTKFLAYHFISHAHHVARPIEIPNCQRKVNAICRNCIFVALERLSEEELHPYDIANSGFTKNGVFENRQIIQSCPEDPESLFVHGDSFVPELLEKILKIYNEFEEL